MRCVDLVLIGLIGKGAVMTIVVGVGADDTKADAVALGAVTSQLLDESVTLVHVHPPTIDYSNVGHVDAEWAAYLREQSDDVLAAATTQLTKLGWSGAVERRVVSARAVSRGLMKVAEELGSLAIVIGPGLQAHDGHVAMGSIAQSLLHGGSCAILMAPEGYQASVPHALGRLVVGFQDTEESRRAVAAAHLIAQAAGVSVELLTVVSRATRIFTPRLGRDPESAVMQALVEREMQAQDQVLAEQGIAGVVVQGDTVGQAMSAFNWRADDLFVLASSTAGPLQRVLLGDSSHKLVRASSSPVLVLPRFSKHDRAPSMTESPIA